MDYKKTNAPTNTETRNLMDLCKDTNNVYESIAVIGKRSNQISANMKEELSKKLQEFGNSSDNLEEIFEKGEKVVIFTSFRKMIDMLCNDIKQRYGVYVNYIDGSVPAKERQLTIDEFGTVVGAGALVLNPKAAGAGLNITCANHAIHYNLEWNPAVEDQASARVFRRGQEKTVFVHRLYYVDTIEEIINEKIQNKRILSDNAIIGNTGSTTDQEYLIKALSASPYKH